MAKYNLFGIGSALLIGAFCGCASELEDEDVGQAQQAESESQRQSAIDKKWKNNQELMGAFVSKQNWSGENAGARYRYQHGDIYYGDAVNGAYMVYGDILKKYAAKNRNLGVLGYPLTDESETAYADGRFNWFEHGSIYAKRGATAAYETHGDIDATWYALGSEFGNLGWPRSDTIYFVWDSKPLRRSSFEYGAVFSNDTKGPWPVLKAPNVNRSKLAEQGFASISVQSVGCCLRVTGSRFTPGDSVQISFAAPWGPEVLDGKSGYIVNSSGGFAWRETDYAGDCHAHDKYMVKSSTTSGYLVTIIARDQHGYAAVGTHFASECSEIYREYPIGV